MNWYNVLVQNAEPARYCFLEVNMFSSLAFSYSGVSLAIESLFILKHSFIQDNI